ncbi:MAG: FAD-binding protein [Pseudomonadota bacterium]
MHKFVPADLNPGWNTEEVWNTEKPGGVMSEDNRSQENRSLETKAEVADAQLLGDIALEEPVLVTLPEHAPDPVANWARSVEMMPAVIARPTSQADVVEILKDATSYPSPVRPMGHFHSTTACPTTTGTLVDMTGVNQILDLNDDTVTVEGGAEYLEVEKALVAKGKHFYVDLQIGNVSMGSLATCDTKDGAYPNEYGQIGAYVVRVKLATADGQVIEVDESQPELLKAVRGSYGLLGIVLEVTLQIKDLESISIVHKSYTFEAFVEALPQLMSRNGSMMMYLFPFANKILVQLRGPGNPKRLRNPFVWPLRNFGVAYGVSLFARFANLIKISTVRYVIQQIFNKTARLILRWFIRAQNTRPTQQTTNYPAHPRLANFTFSIFAFPVRSYAQTLLAYRDFCWDYYGATQYRPDLLSVGYFVRQCDYSLFSYSAESDVLTIDPVATGGAEWDHFVQEFNDFAILRGGKPLFNQTPGLTTYQVNKAFGERLEAFNRIRQQMDPEGRLLNDYFAQVLKPLPKILL